MTSEQSITQEEWSKAVDETLTRAIDGWVKLCQASGAYMPALATRLRVIADDLADRYPDDVNGGRLANG